MDDIKLSDRICFFGHTGCGKTTLARKYLGRVSQFVALDPKHELDMPGVKVTDHFRKNLDRQIVRAPIDEEELYAYEVAIDGAWKRGDAVLYVDEATLVTPPRKLLPAYGRAIRTGRSRGLAVWTASQRPKDLPSAIFTEAEHFFIFQLTWKPDREKVGSFTSDAIISQLEGLRGHDYVYYNVRDSKGLKVRVRERESA